MQKKNTVITERALLISVIVAVVASAGMALLQSMEISFYIIAVSSLLLGIYWSVLGQKYKKKHPRHTLTGQKKMEKKNELSGGWREGWLPIFIAVCTFFGDSAIT